MTEQIQINAIKEIAEDFFKRMTVTVSNIEVNISSLKKDPQDIKNPPEGDREVVDVKIQLEDPQILIGQGGQTLLEVQRLLKTILNKKLQKIFYLNLDINEYKEKKVGYLKEMANSLADQVSLTKEEKVLLPMSAYERRIIHAELSQRMDVSTESQGDGFDRHIVVRPK